MLERVGAPWCGWCRRLDAFARDPEVSKALGKDFVLTKIDLERMRGTKETVAKLRKESEGSGLPWFTFLNAEGEVLSTSTNPAGENTGFPVDTHSEVPHFRNMLAGARARMTDLDVVTVLGRLE